MAAKASFFRHRKSPDKGEFMDLVGPHIEVMFRMAWHWTHNREDAEDLVQDVLIKMAGRVEPMRAVDKLRPWLIRAVYHRYVDLYRRRHSSPFFAEDDSGDEAGATVVDIPDDRDPPIDRPGPAD